MQTISEEQVEKVWQDLSRMNRDGASELAQRMQEEQPAILVYLLAAEEADENRDDPGRLMELGAFIWHAMTEAGVRLPTVTAEMLDAAEEDNIRLLERLDEGSEADYLESVRALLGGYNQMPLLGHVVGSLMGHLSEEEALAGESVGLALLRLKTVLDCLDRAG